MDGAQSFTQRVAAELAPHTPLLACCRRSLVEGLALVTTTPGAIATTRPVAVRAAMQALHAERIAAHVSRVGAARRIQYVLVGVETEVIETRSARVCCRRSRLRGAFLGAGRLVRPDGEPYLEIGCADETGATRLVDDFAVLEVTARTVEGEIMGVRHRTLPIEGVQFHPESVLTPDGPILMGNFLKI